MEEFEFNQSWSELHNHTYYIHGKLPLDSVRVA